MNGGVEISEDMAALLAASVNHRLEVRGELIAAVASTAAGRTTPVDETSQLSLGVIVRWIDAGFVDEAPESLVRAMRVRRRE